MPKSIPGSGTRLAHRTETAGCSTAVAGSADILAARNRARHVALNSGFSETDSTLLASVISELARNIVLYAGCGEIIILVTRDARGTCFIVEARDRGPGIADVSRALMGGYTTSGGLGQGLSGVRRVMEGLDVRSGRDTGTIIRAIKRLA